MYFFAIKSQNYWGAYKDNMDTIINSLWQWSFSKNKEFDGNLFLYCYDRQSEQISFPLCEIVNILSMKYIIND